MKINEECARAVKVASGELLDLVEAKSFRDPGHPGAAFRLVRAKAMDLGGSLAKLLGPQAAVQMAVCMIRTIREELELMEGPPNEMAGQIALCVVADTALDQMANSIRDGLNAPWTSEERF